MRLECSPVPPGFCIDHRGHIMPQKHYPKHSRRGTDYQAVACPVGGLCKVVTEQLVFFNANYFTWYLDKI